MFLVFVPFFLHIFANVVSNVQTDKFEYECGVLTRLETLENELKIAKEAQVASDNKLTEAVGAIQSLQNDLKEVSTVGSSYVRWGRTTCPGNGTELVYSGFTGGSYYNHPGSAVNYLCLPSTPVYENYDVDIDNLGGYVYGTEYQIYWMKFFPDLVDPTPLANNDAPCAVCMVPRSTVLMVPATNICMDGWTLEYMGMLASGYYNHLAASEFICLDDQPEYRPGGSADLDGKVLYLVEGRCGALPCPPYVDRKELTCAVCSK